MRTDDNSHFHKAWLCVVMLSIALPCWQVCLAQQPADTLRSGARPANFDVMGNVVFPPPLSLEKKPAAESFPTLAELFASIDSFYTAQCTANLTEFRVSRKGRWLSWMPTLGAAYVPSLETGQPDRLRPSFSYSLSTVERNFREIESGKAKREAIFAQSRIEAQINKEKVWEMTQRRTLLLEQYRHQEEVFEIDRQLFEFYTTQFREEKITVDVYLIERKKYIDSRFALEQADNQIRQLETGIIAAAHRTPLF